jgi:alpha-tubulin suppressor-like RCC1 family protein
LKDAGTDEAPPRWYLPVEEIAAGDIHTCARVASGSVWCWGDNRNGQVEGEHLPWYPIPIPVRGVEGATQIAAGRVHTCALIKDGSVLCWGNHRKGQLALGPIPRLRDSSSNWSPAPVPGLTDVRQIALGWEHSCAILEDGHVTCWGSNSHGQVGAGDPQRGGPTVVWSPRPVKGVEGAAQLALGYGHTCVRTYNGKVTCWGDGFSCDGPSVVGGLKRVKRISAAAEQTCIEMDRSLWCIETRRRSNEPDVCALPPDGVSFKRVLSDQGLNGVEPGGRDRCDELCFACAIRSDRHVVCWGSTGGDWRLGDDSLSMPVEIPGLREIVEIAAGGLHACALRADQRVFCWGTGRYGELGTGGRADQTIPVEPVWAPGASP